MIETKEGVDSIDEILAVEGIDGVFIGPYDMSGSYGIPGETGSPIVRDACRRIVEACERADKSAGLHIVKPTPQATQQALEDGFTLICLGIDTVFVQEGACAAKALTSNAD